ncbi:FHA domain-containing protein [Mycolicibacterium sp. Y3]
MVQPEHQPLPVPALRISCAGRDYTVTAEDGPITVGRQFPAQVIVDDPRISRNHLRLEVDSTGWVGRDHSTNGVYSSGQRLQEFTVTDSLTLNLGHPDGIPVHLSLIAFDGDVSSGESDSASTGAATAEYEEDDHSDITMAVGNNDLDVVRAGAAVSARRRQLNISQRSLAADGILNAGALIAFEKGRSWPRRSTRAKLEKVLKWPEGTIDRIRRGEAVDVPGVNEPGDGYLAGEDATEAVTTNIVGAPLMAQAVQVALSSIGARAEQLDAKSADEQHAAIVELLAELRNLEHIAAEAASKATRAPSVVMALSEVRRNYRTLMLRAARSRQATPGQKLFAARDQAQLSVAEAANAAGVMPADIAAAEADQQLVPSVESAIDGLRRWLSGK